MNKKEMENITDLHELKAHNVIHDLDNWEFTERPDIQRNFRRIEELIPQILATVKVNRNPKKFKMWLDILQGRVKFAPQF